MFAYCTYMYTCQWIDIMHTVSVAKNNNIQICCSHLVVHQIIIYAYNIQQLLYYLILVVMHAYTTSLPYTIISNIMTLQDCMKELTHTVLLVVAKLMIKH